MRINKQKLKKLKIQGKIISELQKGKDIIWNNKKIKARDLTYMQKGKKITIIMDTCINNNMLKIAKNSDLLITEATYAEKEANLARERSHLTSKQAAQIAKKSKAKKLILTHISQRYGNDENVILDEAKKIFKNTILAEDLMKLEI